jgi:hypothetical protein
MLRAELTPVASERGFEKYGCDEVRFLLAANAGGSRGASRVDLRAAS